MDQWKKKKGLPKQQEQHATGAATAITAEKKDARVLPGKYQSTPLSNKGS